MQNRAPGVQDELAEMTAHAEAERAQHLCVRHRRQLLCVGVGGLRAARRGAVQWCTILFATSRRSVG